MSLKQNLSSYIQKLSHPLKEIRERSLQMIVAKIQLGWEFEDELSETRQLIEMLLKWFHSQEPTLQVEALTLLLTVIKTKAGTYVVKHYGIPDLLTNLYSIRHKLQSEAIEKYDDVIEILQFLNSVQSEDNVGVPRLLIPSISSSSESELNYNKDLHQPYNNWIHSDESLSRGEEFSEESNERVTRNVIKVLLFPWTHLCASDAKTLILVEDALRLLKSMKRCCRFICDVFLRDFPSEVFLNRPTIVQNLLTVVNGSHANRSSDAMYVLLSITRALRSRLRQFTHPGLVHLPKKVDNEKLLTNEVRLELQEIVGDNIRCDSPNDDTLMALKQLPAPFYALESIHTLLSLMARNISFIQTGDKIELLEINELNMTTVLIEELVEFLFECVDSDFWKIEHSTKTHRDIAQKSCMCLRMLGDLLNKYRATFNQDIDYTRYRSTWLRLISCAEMLLSWSNSSSLMPSTLLHALQAAQLDPALELFYPEIAKRVTDSLKLSKMSKDNDSKRKYSELKNLFVSMESCIKFFKDKDYCRSSKSVLNIIKSSLSVLELHQSDVFIKDVTNIIFTRLQKWDLNDTEWAIARNIALALMAHNLQWIQESFYKKMVEAVKKIFCGNQEQATDDKSLMLICDVGVLTEICCHGLTSQSKEVQSSANELMLLLLRGRLLLSEGCWWRLLAALLPITPLLHCYADHDSQLGQAICKSLDTDIAACMGVSHSELMMGLIRLLFVRCPTVQMDAAYNICQNLDDEKYLPPKETLRADVLVNALRRLKPEDFNIDNSLPPSKSTQTTGLLQVLDVLKQDLPLKDDNMGLSESYMRTEPTLEPSLRRSTLQQLSVLMQKQDLHEKFLQYDGIRITVEILRMSLLVDDYLAFPECALSCVSILNSVCYGSRQFLLKIQDLPALLLRVILVFPANESVVQMAGQVLSVLVWAGFILQELNHERKRVLALPLSVVERTKLPFEVQSYWDKSINTEHSSLEWLLNEDAYRISIRVHWSYAWNGPTRILREPTPPPGPLSLRMTDEDLLLLQTACPLYSSTKTLLSLQNATSHMQVNEAFSILESYCYLSGYSSMKMSDFIALPWRSTITRFLSAAPASPKDVLLLTNLLKLLAVYVEKVPNSENVKTKEWIKSSFLDSSNSIILVLSKHTLFPQQTSHESIDVTQLHIHIVKMLLYCITLLEEVDSYDGSKLESLLKILLVCLDKVELKNFHMLGYLNELVKCIRYLTHSKHCNLTEESTEQCMRQISRVLQAGSAGGCKGQACRLDAILILSILLTHCRSLQAPVQRWEDIWNGEVMQSIVLCASAARVELRASSLHLLSSLAQYPQLLPQIQQAISKESLSRFAAAIFVDKSEANIVRSGAATLLASISARASFQSEIYQNEILEQLGVQHFLEVLVDFCKERKENNYVEPNIPQSMLERYAELEVRAQKCGDMEVIPTNAMFVEDLTPTAELLIDLSNVIHNVVSFVRCPIQAWNEQGLFRMLFRCSCWGYPSSLDTIRVREHVCRALARSASINKCVRATLANTKDCLHSFICTFNPISLETWRMQSRKHICEEVSQRLLLLGVILSEPSAIDTVWCELREGRAPSFFNLLLQCIQFDNTELSKAAMYCLHQLTRSISRKKQNSILYDISLAEFFDNIKVLPLSEEQISPVNNNGCSPEYVCEEMCKVLIQLYKKLSTDSPKTDLSQDDFWLHICSSLASLLSQSSRARLYALHRGLQNMLLSTLQTVRDSLSLLGKPVEVIRNSNTNPILNTLQWILVVIDSMMSNCKEAKESFADSNIANSLNRLWPWCMMTELLRETIVHLLHTFTNDCPKSWSTMCTCVAGRCLIVGVCALVSREAALQSRSHSSGLLILNLEILTRCTPHHHARPLILKSEVLSCVYKLRLAERSSSGPACTAWTRLAACLSRYADGAARILALRPIVVPALILPALANAAHHHRVTFLQTPELLDMMSGALLSSDTTQIVTAGRAIWALAANNHKAKLALRSSGVTSALHSALERIRIMRRDPERDRALQLLTYTDSLLQGT